MLANSAIRNLIREAKVAQMYSVIQTSTQAGMQTLDQDLQRMVAKGHISNEAARAKAVNKTAFD